MLDRACGGLVVADWRMQRVMTDPSSAFSSGGNVKDMAERGGDFAGAVAEVATRYRRGIQRIPLALRLTKRLMKMAPRMDLRDFLDLSARFQGQCHHEPEHLEAVQRLLRG